MIDDQDASKFEIKNNTNHVPLFERTKLSPSISFDCFNHYKNEKKTSSLKEVIFSLLNRFFTTSK